ncbi:MAG: hydantoinase B/oxoprolinase family protein [Planctomycetota bacterium]|jgi:N-methylhydantoinase B
MAGQGSPDPVRLEVFHQLLAAVCEEAGALLQRTAISPNIRERRDFSCALFDRDGQLVAQAAHIPVHLGSAGDSVAAVREQLELCPGDVALLNDPYAGGTHLPDVTMVRPVFLDRDKVPSWFLVNRAHHADIGGAVPGSMGVARDLFAEGLVIPPVKLRSRGQHNQDVLRLLAANVRGASERYVDFQAQDASLALAEKRLRALLQEHGRATVEAYCKHLMDYAENMVQAVLRAIPKGTYRAEDVMEDDGVGTGPHAIKLALTVDGRRLRFDFRGTECQAKGGINANRSIVMAACVYVLRCLCEPRCPTNQGLYRRLQILTEPGTLVDPIAPAPVAGGNVETSQRLVDVCLAALRRALPKRVPACSAGTMSNLSLGGAGFAFYETLPGGAGASATTAGCSAIQTHMTNTRNTPVEELELRYPVRVQSLTVRRGSGGSGRHRGGDGLIKELLVLQESTVTLFADRHRIAPGGARRGGPGKTGRARVRSGNRARALPAKGTVELSGGDVLRIETPGGGGWGQP